MAKRNAMKSNRKAGKVNNKKCGNFEKVYSDITDEMGLV